MFTGRVVAPGEPMWTEDDLELALAWQAEKKLHCDGCGHPMDETFDASSRNYQADEITCAACQVIEWRRSALGDQERDMAGVRIYATRRHG